MGPCSFSIVVPTYNRPDILAGCLRSLDALDYPADRYEIIVVDDGTPGFAVRDSVAGIRTRAPLRFLRQENAGPGAARNTAAAHAQADVLAFTDDDCRPAPDWLRQLSRRLEQNPWAGVAGHTVNVLLANPYAEASQTVIDYLYSYFHAHSSRASFYTTNNMAVPAAAFSDLGGFNTTHTRYASEDREFCRRWTDSGRQWIYEPQARVHHQHDLNFRAFWKQHYDYGRGARRYHLACRARGVKPAGLQPPGFYLRLLQWPLRNGVSSVTLTRAALVALTQVAHTAGFLREFVLTVLSNDPMRSGG